jgi:YD repeat-containing protein
MISRVRNVLMKYLNPRAVFLFFLAGCSGVSAEITCAAENVPSYNQYSIGAQFISSSAAASGLADCTAACNRNGYPNPNYVASTEFPGGFSGYCYSGMTYLFQIQGSITAVCPTNSTEPVSGQCTCNTGFQAVNNSCIINSKNLGTSPSCANATPNPIIIGTGNKYHVENDYVGTGLFPLRVQRYYNVDSPVINTLLGTNWCSPFDNSIVVNATTATASRPDGKSFNFQLSGSAWIGDADITDRLQQTTTGWTYTTSDDSVEIYNTSGKLLTITNRAGLTQTLNYSDGLAGFVLDAAGNPTTTTLPANLLIRVSDPSGRSLNFGYNAASRIVKMTDPSGGIYLYGYDTNNNLSSVTYPDGVIRTYQYENATFIHALTGISDQKSATDPIVRYATYSYDPQGRANDEQHAPGLGLPANQEIDHYNLVYGTDLSGNPQTDVYDPLNTKRTYHFTTVLGVVKSTGTDQPGGSGCGAASSGISYDANGNVASRADFNQHKTCYAHDMTRNLETARVEGLNSGDDCNSALTGALPTDAPNARKITTTWHPNYRLPLVITEPGRTTTDTYDIPGSDFLLHTRTITDTTLIPNKSRTWTYSYTTSADNTLVNQLKTVNGPRIDLAPLDDITTYAYYTADDTTQPTPKYRKGDLMSVTDALGHVTQLTQYDGNGRPLTIVDANTNPGSVTTTLAYWPRGWLKSKTVGAKATLYNYDNVGNLTQVTLGDGSFIKYSFDDAHRLTDISDPLLNRIHYTLDAIGNRIKEEVYDSNNKLSTVKARDFDALNNLYHDIAYFNDPNTAAASTLYTYDPNGNLKSATAPANSGTDGTNRTTNFDIDALDRIIHVSGPINPVTATQPTTAYGYNALDQVSSVTDPRTIATGYTVNALGDVNQETSLDKGTTNRTFDEAGNVKSAKDARGIQATYQYDALNRPISVSYPNTSENITYTWDNWITGTGCTYGIGQLCQMTDGNGTTSYSYNDQGNLLKEARLEAGVSMVTQFSYDSANRRISEITPTGETLVFGPNPAGLTNTVTTTNGTNTTILAKQTNYDGAGQITSKLLGNGVKQGEGLDFSGMPASVASNKVDGDLNGDGIVNVVDVMLAEQIAEGLRIPTADQLVHGDVSPPGNPDGNIDVRDVARIMRKAFGLENF